MSSTHHDHHEDDDDDMDIDDVVDSFFDARALIFEHVGYVEDWRVLPIDDSRDQFWAIDEHAREWVKFSSSREALAYWLDNDDLGSHGDKLYQNEIYTQRHLPKWVYRGGELTLVVVDTHTDGNKFLQLFRNHNEVHPGDTREPVAPPAEQQAVDSPSAGHPLNQAIDDLIEADRREQADRLLGKIREMCAAVSPAELKDAIAEHRANCQQPGCSVQAAMEQVAAEAAL